MDYLKSYIEATWVRKKVECYDVQTFQNPFKQETQQILVQINKELQNQNSNFSELDNKYLEKNYGRISSYNYYTARNVFLSNQLGIKEFERKLLLEEINKVADRTMDFHENGVIQDIVDPELNPYYPKDGVDPEFYYDPEIQKITDFSKSINMMWADFEDEENYYDVQYPQNKENNEYVSLRSQYQWIPTQFNIDRNSDVIIDGEILNLPRKDNESLYEQITRVFQEMIPAFKKIGIVNFDGNQKEQENQQQDQLDICNLQVVVKLQKYNVKPNSYFEGKWHLEGKTENIKAAGVYYCQIDPKFEENQLQFNNFYKSIPGQCYGDDEIQNFIDLQEGTALVFQNCPHKLFYVSNKTDEVRPRTILSFFIVDPSKPLKDTKYIENLKENIIKEYGEDQLEQKLREEGFETDINIGKEKRAQVRKMAGKEMSGWGYIHYGNDGQTVYYDSFQANVNNPTPFQQKTDY